MHSLQNLSVISDLLLPFIFVIIVLLFGFLQSKYLRSNHNNESTAKKHNTTTKTQHLHYYPLLITMYRVLSNMLIKA